VWQLRGKIAAHTDTWIAFREGSDCEDSRILEKELEIEMH